MTRWILVLLLTFVTSPAWAATYFVSTTGSDAADGSSATPWRTIQKCANTAASGDTCSVNDGTYTISAGTNTCAGAGTSSFACVTRSGITFKSTNRLGAKLNGNSNTTDYGIYIVANGAVVKDFEMYGLTKNGVFYPHDNTVNGGSVIGNLLHTIGRRCTNFGFGQDGVFMGRGIQNVTVERNILHNIGRILNGTQGCDIFEGTNGDHAIYIEGSTNVTIKHNIFYDIRNGFPLHVYPSPSSNLKILHNTFADPGLATPTPVRSPILCGGAMSSGEWSNNIAYQPVVGFITPIGGCTFTSTNVKNNIVSTATLFQLNGSGVATPSGVTASGNLTSTNPLFTNAASRDYSLTSTSPAINAGVNVSLAFNGSLPDIGALETSGGFSGAVIDLNVMDVTLGMNLNTPLLPATGITGFTVACSGSDCGTPVVASATRKTGTDSVVRLTLSGIGDDGNCDAAQIWTVTYAPGNVTDSALLGGSATQPLFGFTNQAVTETCSGSGTPPPAGVHIHYKLDDGSGTNANDETANNLDGTLTNSATWTATAHTDGGVVTAADSTQYLAIPYGSGVNPSTQSLTIAVGILVDASRTAGNEIYLGSTAGTNQRFHVGTISSAWGLGIQSSSLTVASNLAVTSGWHRICLNVNSGTDIATLFVDGVQGTGSAAKAFTSYTLASNLRLGSPFDDAPPATYDELKVWTSVESCADDFAAWEQVAPAPTGTFEQKTHKWQRLRKTSLDAAEDYTAAGVANGITITVIPGAAVALVTQIDCTVANCDPTGSRLYFSKNGGAFTQVPDVCASDGVCFFGTPDSDVVSGTVTCCLTGALTANDGPTNTSADAVPVFDLTQNASFVRRSVIKFSTAVAPGDTFAFKEYHQTDIALNTYTPSGGAALVIGSYAAGF
jgi:hypothetical protein